MKLLSRSHQRSVHNVFGLYIIRHLKLTKELQLTISLFHSPRTITFYGSDTTSVSNLPFFLFLSISRQPHNMDQFSFVRLVYEFQQAHFYKFRFLVAFLTNMRTHWQERRDIHLINIDHATTIT